MMEVGYQAKDIIKITNIPHATVYRIVDKLRAEAKIDFKELMEKDYLFKYQQNLENLNRTIIQCNEEIIKVNVEYDLLRAETQELLEAVEPNKHVSKANFMTNLIAIRSGRTTEISKLIQQRDRASTEKARLFNSGPVVYRVNEYVENKLSQVPQMLKENVATDAPMNVPEIEDKVDISEEDQTILNEMERDDILNSEVVKDSNDEDQPNPLDQPDY